MSTGMVRWYFSAVPSTNCVPEMGKVRSRWHAHFQRPLWEWRDVGHVFGGTGVFDEGISLHIFFVVFGKILILNNLRARIGLNLDKILIRKDLHVKYSGIRT
jgi:hypothetical protein